VYEHGTNGQATRLGTTPNLGRVLDAVRVGPTVIILREQGLQMVEGGVGRNIATFTKGKAEFGQLVKGFSSDVVVYSYRRSAPRAPFGFEGIVGVIGNGTARKVSDTLRNPLALGLTANGRGIYIIEQGQDPSFAEVKVVAIDDGRTLATLPIAGVGGGMLAPDRQMMVTVDQPREHPDTLIFWDLNNQTGAPRNVIPQPGKDIWSLIWAPNSRLVYAGIYPTGSEARGELWRVDPLTRRSEVAVRDLPVDTHPLYITDDGRTLVAQTREGNALVLDLQTGNRQSVAFPMGSVIAH
jgi:dipeptidyl aminopeptidase/acylaminoacyl peptidase